MIRPNENCMVYRNVVANIQTVRSWFRKFRADNFNVEDEEHCGHLLTTDRDVIKAMTEENLL